MPDIFDMMEANEATKSVEYKGKKLERRDPYGFVYIVGEDAAYTSFQEAEKAIDARKVVRVPSVAPVATDTPTPTPTPKVTQKKSRTAALEV